MGFNIKKITIEQFANELGVAAEILMQQLRAAGINKQQPTDFISKKDKAALLDHLRYSQQKHEGAHGQSAERKMSNPPSAISPKGDERYRTSSSARLWVMSRSYSQDKGHVIVCGLLESIQGTIYSLRGRSGLSVRYLGYYHLLHTPEEFSELLANAKKRKFDFFNNELGGRSSRTELLLYLFRQIQPIGLYESDQTFL